MSTTATEAAIIINLTDLENLIRRVVREAVREELTRLLRTPDRSILDYWEHEGPDDPAGDEQLLAEALVLIQQYEENPEGSKTLEEFESDLAGEKVAYRLQDR